MRCLETAQRLAIALPLVILGVSPTTAQITAPPSGTPVEVAVAQALLADPMTAPYRIGVEFTNGRLVLSGRVGSKAVHDVAVRTAIASGVPISDNLVIDTTEAYRVAAAATPPQLVLPAPPVMSSYTYPPPLFGRYDDPFFGLEPPLITYPPWWAEMSARRLAQPPLAPVVEEGRALPSNAVEMTIDPRGVAVIRGVVPTEADRVDVGQRLAQTPGVTGIINRLTVGPVATPAPATMSVPRTIDDRPPPPPTPSVPTPAVPEAEPTGSPIDPTPDRESLSSRLERAVRGVAEGVEVRAVDGVATLSGSVPTVYEAMLAFRAAQRTPGVREVVDRLQFVVPDGSGANPLLDRRDPADVAAYLEAQIKRQVGDAAHVDDVSVSGPNLRIRGTLVRASDRPRVEAILRSMPILRGFTLLPDFRAGGD